VRQLEIQAAREHLVIDQLDLSASLVIARRSSPCIYVGLLATTVVYNRRTHHDIGLAQSFRDLWMTSEIALMRLHIQVATKAPHGPAPLDFADLQTRTPCRYG
jgi:hypothetical protein